MVLRVALPERGESAARARELLEQAGFGATAEARPSVRFFRLPERDIAVYANHGDLHLALTGSLAIAEASVSARSVVDLDSTSHELVLLAPPGGAAFPDDLAGARVATPYPQLVRRYFAVRGIGVDKVIALDPAEHGVELGIADAVAVVLPVPRSPAGPLAGLRPLDVVQACRLVAIEGRGEVDDSVHAARQRFVARLRAARLADTVALVQFECPDALLESVLDGLPSARAPEVSAPGSVALGGVGSDRSGWSDWSTVRLLVGADDSSEVLQLLWARGCREILTFRPRMYEPGAGRVVAVTGRAPAGSGALPEPRGARGRP